MCSIYRAVCREFSIPYECVANEYVLFCARQAKAVCECAGGLRPQTKGTKTVNEFAVARTREAIQTEINLSILGPYL